MDILKSIEVAPCQAVEKAEARAEVTEVEGGWAAAVGWAAAEGLEVVVDWEAEEGWAAAAGSAVAANGSQREL